MLRLPREALMSTMDVPPEWLFLDDYYAAKLIAAQ
jgi:hypothetical protein